MPLLAHFHQRFNAATCHASIPTRRGNDRPRHCPRGQSHAVRAGGHDHSRPRWKRAWGHGRRHPCHDLTDPLCAQRQRSPPPWLRATLLVCLSGSPRRLARALAGPVRTRDRWGWWRRHAALSSAMARQWVGTGDADERDHPAGRKGHAKHGGRRSLGRRPRHRRQRRAPGRGHDAKDRPALIAWVSRPGPVVVRAVRAFPVTTVPKAAALAAHRGRRRSTDAASSARTLQGEGHEGVQQTQTESARGEIPAKRAECLFSRRKPDLRGFRGIRNTTLPGSLGFVHCLRNVRP